MAREATEAMDAWIIHRMGNTQTLAFAAAELRRYLTEMTGKRWAVRGRTVYAPEKAGIWLGVFGDTGIEPVESDPGAQQGPFRDEIAVRVGPNGGLIAGANPRSVLLGVYRYLTELGCRWLRPGRDGEHVPALRGEIPSVQIRETPSYPHRGVCIEGAVSYEHVRDMVDWLPKLGFNAYFIQFREAYNFFQRWYEHEGNPTLPRRTFPLERAGRLTRKLRGEIKKRGLVLHMVGHGWTCEPFGIAGPGWFKHKGPIPPSAVEHLAEVNGERKLWGDIALNTNLCYGNPETRDIVTNAIVDYAGANPDVDVIHFWLADGSNNQCECELCRDQRPSDLYVTMLNELDAKLTRESIGTKIVFLAYVDLLWPPRTERFANPERFILMFAPITRSYSTSFASAARGETTSETPSYERNRLQFPREPGVNLRFLTGWRQVFSRDSFDFDYHFMWDHFKDPAQFGMARVLNEDIRGLRDIGLNGFMSCQVQRSFFPTGLGMTVLGRTLWNRDLSFEEIEEDYFRAAFGPNGGEVSLYLAGLSELFCPRVLRGEGDEMDIGQAASRLTEVGLQVDGFRSSARKQSCVLTPAQAQSWAYLEAHGQVCRRLARALEAHYDGRTGEARQAGWDLFAWVRDNEASLHPVLDVYEFQLVLGPILGISREEVLARS